MNIFSGSTGLGAALTNPTELAYKKGNLKRHYRVAFRGRTFNDAEAAYQKHKTGDVDKDDELMAEIIACKLDQHPSLFEELVQRGGIDFIESCDHFTGARTHSAASWEGKSVESRFIRNLITGFVLKVQKKVPETHTYEQVDLFE